MKQILLIGTLVAGLSYNAVASMDRDLEAQERSTQQTATSKSKSVLGLGLERTEQHSSTRGMVEEGKVVIEFYDIDQGRVFIPGSGQIVEFERLSGKEPEDFLLTNARDCKVRTGVKNRRVLALPRVSYAQIFQIFPETLERLSLSGCSQMDEVCLEQRDFPNLTHLTLKHCRGLIAEGLERDFPNLTSLTLQYCEGLKAEDLARVFPNLTSLSLGKHESENLENFAQIPPNLTHLTLSSGWNLTSLCTPPPNLTHLTLLDCFCLTSVDFFPQGLTHLTLSRNSNLTSVDSLPQGLIHLDLSRNFDLMSVGPFPEGLRSLNLSECFELMQVGSLPQGLTFLDLSKNLITFQVLDTLPKGLTHLGLKLEDTNGEDTQHIFPPEDYEDFPSEITSLSLASNVRVTDQRLEKLLQRFPNLTSLSIPHCWWFTDTSLATLVQSVPRNLISLSLIGCDLTDKDLEDLAQRLSNLTHLNLSMCHAVTDKGLMDLAQSLPNLTHLNLQGMRTMRDKINNDLRAQRIKVTY